MRECPVWALQCLTHHAIASARAKGSTPVPHIVHTRSQLNELMKAWVSEQMRTQGSWSLETVHGAHGILPVGLGPLKMILGNTETLSNYCVSWIKIEKSNTLSGMQKLFKFNQWRGPGGGQTTARALWGSICGQFFNEEASVVNIRTVLCLHLCIVLNRCTHIHVDLWHSGSGGNILFGWFL